VFLILAIFFSMPLFPIFKFSLSDPTGTLVSLVLYGWCPALFWWLFLRKEKEKKMDNAGGPPVSRSIPNLNPNTGKPLTNSVTSDLQLNVKATSEINLSAFFGEPSSEAVKKLIPMYQRAETQDERNKILMPLLFNLCRIPLTFLVLYEPIQKPIEEIRNTPLYDLMKPQTDAVSIPMVRRFIRPLETENGHKIVYIFTDSEAYEQSGFPSLINRLFMEAYTCFPTYYLHMLKDLQYDGVVINPDTQNHFFPKDLFEMFMAKGVETKSGVGEAVNVVKPDIPEPVENKLLEQTEIVKKCCLFSTRTFGERGKGLPFDEIENLGGGDGEGYSWGDGSRKLCRCKNCGALFLNYEIRFLAMNYEQDDISYSYYLPAANREQALEYNEKYIGATGLKDSYTGEKIWFNGSKWCWE